MRVLKLAAGVCAVVLATAVPAAAYSVVYIPTAQGGTDDGGSDGLKVNYVVARDGGVRFVNGRLNRPGGFAIIKLALPRGISAERVAEGKVENDNDGLIIWDEVFTRKQLVMAAHLGAYVAVRTGRGPTGQGYIDKSTGPIKGVTGSVGGVLEGVALNVSQQITALERYNRSIKVAGSRAAPGYPLRHARGDVTKILVRHSGQNVFHKKSRWEMGAEGISKKKWIEDLPDHWKHVYGMESKAKDQAKNPEKLPGHVIGPWGLLKPTRRAQKGEVTFTVVTDGEMLQFSQRALLAATLAHFCNEHEIDPRKDDQLIFAAPPGKQQEKDEPAWDKELTSDLREEITWWLKRLNGQGL